jgi:hypothetical protein
MKISLALLLGCLGVTVLSAAAAPVVRQADLSAQQKTVAGWAADPVIIAAVKAQNAKGPLPGMTNASWKALPATSPDVQAFMTNPAGMLLARQVKASNGMFTEAFLNAAKGEKVAFEHKPTSYLHAGTPKFDVPMTGKAWQGEHEFDDSTGAEATQIAVPVRDGNTVIGVLVVGVATKAPAAKK